MRAEDLVFWLDVLHEDDRGHGGRGVLCRRHADSMVVPRNWTLDDLREPDLHLFRPPPADGARSRRSSRRASGGRAVEQLELAVEPVVEFALEPANGPANEAMAPPADEAPPNDAGGAPLRRDEPWSPIFDASDDLGGLLAARSPLLARAFRGTDRSKGD